jgi:hypothetical protein
VWSVYGQELMLAGIVAMMLIAAVVAVVWRENRVDPEHSTQVVLSDDDRATLTGAADAKARQVAVERRSVKKKVKAARRTQGFQIAEGRRGPGAEN